MSKRILCKFFLHGACLKGEYCEFSHDWQDQPNNICTFYQKGVCSYGNRCRYDHVKVSRQQTSRPSSLNAASHVTSDFHQVTLPPVVSLTREYNPEPSTSVDVSAMSLAHTLPCKPAWTKAFEVDTSLNDESGPCPTFVSPADQPICGPTYVSPADQPICGPTYVSPADQPICSFAASGKCPRGDRCPHIHGDLCSICGKHCLHPFRPDEREEHIKMCHKNNKHLEALKCSQEIECSVCLEHVLSKPTAAERKFGLLSECDHPFCISCIRNWRSNSPASGMDVNSALRACPICRKLSYFVIPSVIWYSTKEEKQEIVDSYKIKLKSIDCKYFDFGNGTCPFGTSCFYKHAYRDGRLEEVVLRHLDTEDGSTVIAKDIRLSDFFNGLHL